ncbi:hypothetical protein Moror_13518 [Moniliophthora roreri MCA 2997]|uniref:Uncharacterized protein n=1 Tax=Moniliophthora roreri (strain MCA 2997) TaxID=1381753 RepID=V2WUF5_MONRO|nr:hypothetical protein Moror_13518 [Moniliophthora roreri MCA 2997]
MLDIVKIEHFEEAIVVVRGTIQAFNKSTLRKAALQTAQEALQTGPNLESIGHTHFSTITMSSILVQCSLPAIKEVVKNGKFVFEMVEYFETPPSLKCFHFEVLLHHFIDITTLIAMALACLEADDANPAHVWIIWHAVIFTIEQYIKNSKNSLSATAYLNPAYRSSNLFVDGDVNPKEPVDAKTVTQIKGVQCPKLFYSILNYLVNVGSKEVEHSGYPELTQWKRQAGLFLSQLQKEFTSYAHSRYLYNLPYDTNLSATQGLIDWWRQYIGDNNVIILLHLAIKIFSICVNSMADERTASTFTWMNTDLCNRQTVDTMGSKAQIYKFYHTEHKLSEKPKASPIRAKSFCNIKPLFDHTHKKPEMDKACEKVTSVDADNTWLDEANELPGTPNTVSLLIGAWLINPSAVHLQAFISDTDANELSQPNPTTPSSVQVPTAPSSQPDTDYALGQLSWN